MRIYKLLLVFLVTSSCNQSPSYQEYFNSDLLTEISRTKVLDSIPLYDSIHYFNYSLNTDQYEKNIIVASRIPSLAVYLLDTTGQVRRKVSQKGNAPGLLGNANFALTAVGESGKIYVLTSGNAYTLHVFDKNGDFLDSYPLHKELPELYVPQVNASFIVVEKEDGIISVSFSTGSSMFQLDSPKYYEESTGVAQFTIDLLNDVITGYDKKLPLINQPEIKEALKGKGRHWEQSNPVFDYENGKFYLIFPFSKNVNLYDENFVLLEKIPLDTLDFFPNYGFHHEIAENDYEFFRRAVISQRMRNENLNIQAIDVQEQKILIQFPQIFEEGTYPLIERKDLGVPKQLGYTIYNHVLIKDLSSGKEQVLTLPADYYQTRYIGQREYLNSLYLPNEKEKSYLIKHRHQ